MKSRVLAVLGVLLAVSACRAPKYIAHTSVFRDFTASVPWDWDVMTDAEGEAFTQVTFIGPFEEDFYLGAPSLSVRWYRNNRPHRLRDGSLELYSGADDFIAQTLKKVYGERSVLYGPGGDGQLVIVEKPHELTLKAAGLPAQYFVVLSPAPAQPEHRYGLEQDSAGRSINMRKHAYAVVPVDNRGFYVLTYPATRRGYERYEDRFRALLGSFRLLTAGPAGPRVSRRAQ